MSSKKVRDSSKSKHSRKEDYPEDKYRSSSKDHRSPREDQETSSKRHGDRSESHRSKTKSSSKPSYNDDDAAALAEEEEERRRRKRQLRKQLEEEERLKREEEAARVKREQEFDEERRKRKEKKREAENGDSRHPTSSRALSPPQHSSPPPSKHTSKTVEKDAQYSDEFEQNYDDDFDDDAHPAHTKKPSRSHREEKSRYADDEPPSTRHYPPSSGRDESQVFSSSRRLAPQGLSDRLRTRRKDLSRLIQLDRQSFNILDMTPMPAHAAYMRDIRLSEKKNTSSTHNGNQKDDDDDGAGGTANVKTQTNDDAENVQSQTDEIDVRVMWTQHPSEGEHTACGSGSGSDANQLSDEKKTRENEELLRVLRLETDLGRYQTFVVNAGKLIFALLDEQEATTATSMKSKSKRSKGNDEGGMQDASDLNFSSGRTILPGLSFKSAVPIAAACFCPDKPDQVVVFYQPMYTTGFGAVYNIHNPDKPWRLLSCEASVRCCSSSMVYIFAGCHDGSVVLFDTSEPSRYSSDSPEPLPSGPTFSTANIQFNDRHSNEVIRVMPLRPVNTTSKAEPSTGSFSLASLDKDGRIILWSVVELKQTDEAGSIADFGLKPGGRVRMIQSSSIQIKQSIHMARDSIQAFDMSCPNNEMDHLYVATNASAVYHMTRYGEMGCPSKLRLSSTPDSLIEVTCLAFNPVINKLLLVGTGHGQLYLYTTGRDEPILTCPNAFRSSSAVLSCAWSTGRPSVFFAHDSQGYIKYWDLTKDQHEPLGQVQVDNLTHFILSTSNQYETAYALILRQQSSQIEVHQLKQTLATHSDTFMDNLRTILKELMSNT